MKRKIIKIDEKKCNGCGLCADACHEGAIAMVNGIAKLIRDDYCDGLGDCLPACEAGAITFEEREAAPYDEGAVKRHLENRSNVSGKTICEENEKIQVKSELTMDSKLMQWPVQIKLVPVNAPYFHEAKLLIAADCTAFSYGNFHHDFMEGRITLIGCPKLDQEDYSQKLALILKNNTIREITVVRMEVPCCSGIANATRKAVELSGKEIPLEIATISVQGKRI